jgi:hypothetical protein
MERPFKIMHLSSTMGLDKKSCIGKILLTIFLSAMKLDLLTNASVVDDAIRFVYDRSLLGNSNESDKKESNEPNYDEDKDQLEEEQEEEAGEITTAMTNQVF